MHMHTLGQVPTKKQSVYQIVDLEVDAVQSILAVRARVCVFVTT
jgi:hypothetical protein